MELCNAYTELNDPEEQRKRFTVQQDDIGSFSQRVTFLLSLSGVEKSQATIDSEAEYVRTLEHGLPPTGGFGLGVDRLVMLLTGTSSIRVCLMNMLPLLNRLLAQLCRKSLPSLSSRIRKSFKEMN